MEKKSKTARDQELRQAGLKATVPRLEILKLLEAADSFETMVLAVNGICGGHEANDEVRRFVDSVL